MTRKLQDHCYDISAMQECQHWGTLSDHEENKMKKETTKPGAKKLSNPVENEITEKAVKLDKKQKSKKTDDASTPAPKVKKLKSEKVGKEIDEPKGAKAPKDDKLTKFLVSMKKSVRKSIKKEAAEVGVSMNEYIVLAVDEKLGRNSGGVGAK
jgi:hypothetical protein